MVTIIKDNKNNNKTIYRTQQYEIGLYLIINDDSSQQIAFKGIIEKQFHKELRESAIKNNNIIFNGTVLTDIKSKYGINKFEENE